MNAAFATSVAQALRIKEQRLAPEFPEKIRPHEGGLNRRSQLR